MPVAKRRANTAREMNKLRKKGMNIEPVEIAGRKIARTFWGQGWCEHLEQFSDYANRLPRGRAYVRNGSVCHLEIKQGKVDAIVSGSELYRVGIEITPLPKAKWKRVREQCTGQIGSMLELLQGRLSKSVMQIVTHRTEGLFPQPREIKFSCDCPDWADMCKHVAAVLYGVGARLDQKPDLLFLLRNADQEQLISAELDMRKATAGKGGRRRLAGRDLSDVFGVEIEDAPAASAPGKRVVTGTAARSSVRKVAAKKAAQKKTRMPTATSVARLRKRFDMNRSQFSELLGVSQQAVAIWENSSGKLNLRQRTREALIRATELTPDQAWAKLTGGRG